MRSLHLVKPSSQAAYNGLMLAQLHDLDLRFELLSLGIQMPHIRWIQELDSNLCIAIQDGFVHLHHRLLGRRLKISSMLGDNQHLALTEQDMYALKWLAKKQDEQQE